MCVGEIATVLAVDRGTGTATLRPEAPTAPRAASTALHPEVEVGARVVVHTGFIVDLLEPHGPVEPPVDHRGVDHRGVDHRGVDRRGGLL